MPTAIVFTKIGIINQVKGLIWKFLELSMLLGMVMLFGAIFSGKMYSVESKTSVTHTRADYDFLGYMNWDFETDGLTGNYYSYENLKTSSISSTSDQGAALETFGKHIRAIFISAATFGVAWYPLHWISWALQTFALGKAKAVMIIVTLIIEAVAGFSLLLTLLLSISGIGDFRDRFPAVYCTSQTEVGFCAEKSFSGSYSVSSVTVKWYPYTDESSAYLMSAFACVFFSIAFILACVQYVFLFISVFPALKAARSGELGHDNMRSPFSSNNNSASQAPGLAKPVGVSAPNFGTNFGAAGGYGGSVYGANPTGAYVKA